MTRTVSSDASDYEVHGFDAAGNEALARPRSCAQILFTYDALNRLAAKAPAGQATISYYYDYTGRLLQARASTDGAAYAFAYRTQLASPGSPSFATTSAFDALNRVTDIFPSNLRKSDGIQPFEITQLFFSQTLRAICMWFDQRASSRERRLPKIG